MNLSPFLLSSILKIIFEVFGVILVSVQLFSPHRPVVDVAEVFLWLMAVGTIVCASFWSAWSAKEASIEQDKLLKVFFLVRNQYKDFCSLILKVVCHLTACKFV